MLGLELKELDFRISELKVVQRILEMAGANCSEETIGDDKDVRRSQSTVSRILQRCEKLLDTPAHKDGKLTEKGNELCEAIKNIQKAITEVASATRFGSTQLRIGSIPSVLASFMPRVVSRLTKDDFFRKHPSAAIHLESYPASQLVERLDRGLLDLVIGYPHRDGLIDRVAEWTQVKLSRWMMSNDVHCRFLFDGLPVGLLYHRSNKLMHQMRCKPGLFSFERFRSLMVFLTSDPTQPAFETEFEKCLPEPDPKSGTRVAFQTFSQIRASLTSNSPELRSQAVGLGVELPGDKKKRFELMNFKDVLAGLEHQSPSSPDYDSIRVLAELSEQGFFAYAKKTGRSVPFRNVALQDLISAVEKASATYKHTYVA